MRNRRKELKCGIHVIWCSCCHTLHTEVPKYLPHLHFSEPFGVSSKKWSSLKQECTDFPETREPAHISVRQKCDLKKTPKILGANVENLVATGTWFPWFMHPWLRDILIRNWISPRISYSNSHPSWLVLGICCRLGCNLRGPMFCSKLRY